MKVLNKILIIIALLFLHTKMCISDSEWSNAGLLPNTPILADHLLNVEEDYTGSDDVRVQAAISDARIHSQAGETTLIYFPARTYELHKSIRLSHLDSNIVFQGDGSDATILKFTFNNPDSNCFYIVGEESDPHITTLQNTVNYLSKEIMAYNLSGLNVGDWFRLSEYNHDVYYEDVDWATGCVGQISRLVSKNGNNGTMEDQAGKIYQFVDANNLRIYIISPVKNIGIENLRIWRNDNGHGGTGTNGITTVFKYAINCWMKGVHYFQTCKHHVQADYSAHIFISGCYFNEAQYYGEGGYGYGVQLTGSTSLCLIENNIFNKLRHAMMVQAGANHNVFTFNYSYKQYCVHDTYGRGPICGFLGWPEYCGGDICLHGNYPFSNLFEQNWSCIIVADGYHGSNGPNNWFFRNMTYDDERGDQHCVNLHNTPDYQIGGSMCEPERAACITITGGESFGADWFGHYEGSAGMWGHVVFYNGTYGTDAAYLPNISRFYASRPDFLFSNYSWPSIGPKLDRYDNFSTISQNIPARDRFDNTIKTYLQDPTLGPLTTSGPLPYSQTWSGTHTLTGNVTIPSGITLTILPGTQVYIPSGKKITVQGTLIAEGTSSNPITFDKSGFSKWYGIKFEDSSDDNECILQYCTIQNASYGAYCYKASPAIIYCNINNNTTGIYKAYGTAQQDIFDNDIGYNSMGGVSLTNAASSINVSFYDNDVHHSSYVNFNCSYTTIGPDMDGNKIRNCSGNGMNVYSSTAYLESNFVYDNNGYGIYCNSSSPELSYDDKPGKNVVAYNGNYGIYVDANSYPILGNPYPNGQNSYYSNNTYDVYSLYPYPWIAAGDCYWGGGTPAVYGYVWTYPQRSNNPNLDPHSLLKLIAGTTEKGNFEKSTYTESDKDAHKHYDLAYELEQKGEYEAAIEKYKYVIATYPQTIEAEWSLNRIIICYHNLKSTINAFTYMETLAADKADIRIGGKALGYLTKKLVEDGDYQSALANCTSQLQKFADSDIAKDALFTKWQIYFDGLKEDGKTKSAMNEFELSFPDDYLLAHIKNAMGEWTPEMEEKFLQNLPKRIGEQPEQAAVVEIPEKFTLSGNYPNPFNPETTIKFGLPEESHVSIEIFNVLGQKVKRLLDSEKPTGYHSIRWDGRNEFGKKVGAGVYLCRMQAGDFIKTLKMMLLP